MEELKWECLDNIKEYQRVSRNEPPPSVQRFTEALSSKGKAPVIGEDYEEQEALDTSEESARSSPRRTSTIRSLQIPPRFKPIPLLRQQVRLVTLAPPPVAPDVLSYQALLMKAMERAPAAP